MDLLLNEEQSMLRQSVGAFAKRLGPSAPLRRLPALPGRFAARDFEEAAAAGWLGLLLPPDQGGSGLGLTELCLVAEELGGALSAASAHAGDRRHRRARGERSTTPA